MSPYCSPNRGSPQPSLQLHRHVGLLLIALEERSNLTLPAFTMASVADYFGEDDEELLYKKLNGDLNYKDIMKELDERIHKYYFERSVIVSNGSPQLRLDHIHDSTAASRRIFDAKHRAILLARNKVQHLNAYDLWARAMIRLIGEVDHPVFAMRVIKDSTKDAALSLVQEWGNRKEAACIQAWVSLINPLTNVFRWALKKSSEKTRKKGSKVGSAA